MRTFNHGKLKYTEEDLEDKYIVGLQKTGLKGKMEKTVILEDFNPGLADDLEKGEVSILGVFNNEDAAEKFYAEYRKFHPEYSYIDFDAVEKLATIKEHLFDAPADVKASFNEVVRYFDGRIRGIDPAMVRHGHSILENYEEKGIHYDPIKVLMKEIPGCSKEVAEFIAGSF